MSVINFIFLSKLGVTTEFKLFTTLINFNDTYDIKNTKEGCEKVKTFSNSLLVNGLFLIERIFFLSNYLSPLQ